MIIGSGGVAAVVLPLGASGASPDVTVTTVPTYGSVLATGSGLPLYTFANDSNGQSACNSTCLQIWPPLTVPSGATPVTGPGVPAGIGTAVQSDGRNQVTYNGMPLYTFYTDTPGHANGQGQGGFSLAQVTVTSTTTAPPATTVPPTTVPGSPSTTVPSTPTTTARGPGSSTTVAPGGGSGMSGGATSSGTGGRASGAPNPVSAAASSPSSLAFTGVGDWLRSFALIGLVLVGLGGAVLLLWSPAVGRRPERSLSTRSPGR